MTSPPTRYDPVPVWLIPSLCLHIQVLSYGPTVAPCSNPSKGWPQGKREPSGDMLALETLEITASSISLADPRQRIDPPTVYGWQGLSLFRTCVANRRHNNKL